MARALSVAVGVLASSPVGASGAAVGDGTPPHLVAASSDNFPPINFLDTSGELSGFGRELSRAVVAAAGGTLSHRHSPIWGTVMELLRSGEADFIQDVGYTPERDRDLDFSEPILEMPEVIFVREDSYDIRGLDSLRGRRVACVRGHISHEFLVGRPDVSCSVVSVPVEGLYQLLHREVDAFPYPKQIILYLAQELGIGSQIKIAGAPTRVLSYAMAVREGDRQTLAFLNRGLSVIRGNGQYERIYDKWFGQSATLGYSGREARNLALFAGAISLVLGWAIGLALHNRKLRRTRSEMRRTVRDLRRAENVLAEREMHFRSLIENALDLIAVVDAGGIIRFVSPSVATSLGQSPGEVTGQDSMAFVHDDDRPRVKHALEGALAQPGSVQRLSFRMMHRDGSWRLFEAMGRAFSDMAGTPQVVVNARDVTERERAQEALRARDEQLRQSQKMEAIGQLAGGLAHDFNNLLTVILSCSASLERAGSGRADSRDLAVEIRRAAERAASLTRQLLAFGRRQVLQPQRVDLNEIVRDSVKLLGRLLGEDIQITTRLAADLPALYVDRGQMTQVMLNLAVNSRDAMPRGGTLLIETAGPPAGDGAAEGGGGERDREVELRVSDSGSGMAPETRAHLFEPFFTTKGVGKGTGLGLATVHGIVHQSGGRIHVESEPGKGTTFRIVLPGVAAASPGERERAPVAGAAARGRETILLVEDDPAVRAVARRSLEGSGYRVLEAVGGEEALRIAASHAGDIHLLLSDVVMPRMSGLEVADRLGASRPTTRVLFFSGHAEDALRARGIRAESVRLIEKPFTPQGLCTRVREVLDEKRVEASA